jgi:RNA polymerase sigma-70 factor (ECF subfamily)
MFQTSSVQSLYRLPYFGVEGSLALQASWDTDQDPMRPEAEEQIQPAASIDSDAFEALITPHLAMFHHGIYRILGHHQDTQDALQDALLSIYRNFDKFEGRSQFSSWAYRICINSALMHRRSRKRIQEESLSDFIRPGEDENQYPDRLEVLTGASTPPEAHDLLEQRELREWLMLAMDSLPPAQREVFVLRDIEDWKTEDVARQLGVSSLLVRQRLHRARVFLLNRLRGSCQSSPLPATA